MKSALLFLIVIVTQLPAFAQGFTSRPSECQKKDLLTNGTPMMTTLHDHLAIGVSLAKREFKANEQIRLHIWVDNSGDAPAEVNTCMDLDHFKTRGIDLFGGSGQRILSRDDLKFQEKLSSDPSIKWKFSPCKRSIQITIPAHTCITGDDYDFAIELTSRYDLPPNQYVLRLRTIWRNEDDFFELQGNEPFHTRPGDLIFKVTKP